MGNTRFKDEKHKAMIGVLYVANLINKQNGRIFERENLNAQKYNTLRILRGQYPGSATEKTIKEKVVDKTVDFPRMFHSLEREGLVDRVRNDRDKRIIDLIITEKGLSVLSELDKFEAELSRSTSLLSTEETHQLNHCLQKMLNALSKDN